MKVNDISTYLASKGIKPSYQRIRILEYLINYRTHPTVDEIYKNLVKEIPTLSKTTVYNTLNLFVDKNIVAPITIEENEIRFDADTSLHGHFKCEKCKKIYDFSIDLAKTYIDGINNFIVNERHVYFKGICNECIEKMKK
jgi:Fe2+ or Zn2+ uptake regulation protein